MGLKFELEPEIVLNRIVVYNRRWCEIKYCFSKILLKLWSWSKSEHCPKYSKKMKLIHQNDQLEALITMHASKIRTSNYKMVKIGFKVDNFFSTLRRVYHIEFSISFFFSNLPFTDWGASQAPNYILPNFLIEIFSRFRRWKLW